MSTDSPAAILYDTDSNPLAILPDDPIPADTSGILSLGVDGYGDAKKFLTDTSGRITITTEGSDPIEITGNISSNNDSVGTVGSAILTKATQIGSSDGTNLQVPRVFDVDSGGGTQYVLGAILRKSASGGSVEFGTSSDPIRIDPTGTTTQPVSGTITANIGTTNGLALDSTLDNLTIPLSTALGSNTQVLTGGSVTTASPTYTTGNINPLSLTTAGALRTDSSAVTQPVSGTVTANAGTGNFIVIGTGTDNTSNSTAKLPVIAALANTLAPSWSNGNMVPLSVDTSGALRVTGTISASNPSVSTTSDPPPASATYIGGSVTTAAPIYANGDMDALSLNTSGGLRVDGSGVTQPVSGTVTANQGTAALATAPWAVRQSDGSGFISVATDRTTAAGPFSFRLSDGSAFYNTVTGTQLPAALVSGRLDTNIGAWLGSTAPTVGQKTSANSVPIVIASDQSSFTVTANIGTTGGLALDATLDNLTIAQSAALGSNTQALIGGSVTTASPTYTTGNINPISLTTAGALRTDSSATTQPVSGTVAATQSGTWTVQPGNTANTTPWLTTINQGGNSATVTGANALKVDGSAVTQPVSGTVTVTQSTAANLLANVGGLGANAAAVSGNPVRVGGSDGTNTRDILTDTSGRLNVVGAAANGAAVAGNPVLTAGYDGTNARTLRTLTDGTLQIRYKEIATFTGLATATAPANNKSMWSILNAGGSTVKAKIHEIYLVNVQNTNVAGVVITFELRRITGHSAGTAITAIETMETTDTLDSSITIRTNSTVVGESTTLLWRSLWSSDEWVANTLDEESTDHDFQTMFPIYAKKTNDSKPISLLAGEGLTIKCATNTTVGTFDLLVIFTQE